MSDFSCSSTAELERKREIARAECGGDKANSSDAIVTKIPLGRQAISDRGIVEWELLLEKWSELFPRLCVHGFFDEKLLEEFPCPNCSKLGKPRAMKVVTSTV